MDLKFLVKVSLYFFVSCAALAQDNVVSKKDSVYQLKDIVVSADRYETSLQSTASSVTLINAQEIALSKKRNLMDLLRNEYGVNILQSGGPGKLATVHIRGASASHTLVLLDGIEMNMPNDPGSVYDFSNLPLTNIERIEILRGPQSTLYGSEAMAGVINIITGQALSGSRYFLNAEAGTYNSYSGTAGLSGRLENLDYFISLSGNTTEGFSSASRKYGNTEKDGAENKVISSKIGYWITGNLRFNLSSRFTAASADYDQFGGRFGDDPTYLFNMEETAVRPELRLSLGIWEQSLGAAFYRNVRKYSFDSTSAYFAFSNSHYDGKKYKLDWLNNIRFSESNILSFGVDLEKENAVSNYREYNSTYTFESVFPENEMNTIGFFVQHKYEVMENLFLSGGIRNDIHDRFGSIITYRFGSVYYLKGLGLKFKGNIGTGFKTPSLFNLYDPTFGNKDLDPEESTGWDIGLEYLTMDRQAYGFTVFGAVYDNLFGSDENFRTININKAETSGVEFFWTYTLTDVLRLKFNYTYTRSIDKNPLLDINERKLLRRPEHKAGLGLNYQFIENAGFNLEIIYTGSRKDKNFSVFPAATEELKPYTIVNTSFSYKFFEYLELYTRIENLTDTDYEEIYGYASSGFAGYVGFKLIF